MSRVHGRVSLTAFVVFGSWLAALAARADGGPLCAAVSGETVSVDEADPRLDVYAGSGDQWLTMDLRERYARPSEPPQSAAGLRFQAQRIAHTLEESGVFQSKRGKALRQRLLDELALLDAALAELAADKPVAVGALKNRYPLARLDGSSRFAESCAGTAYTTNSLYFQDAPAGAQVVLGAFGESRAGVPGLSIPVAGPRLHFVSIAEASEFRAALEALRALTSEPHLRAVARTSLRLTQISRSWSNYLEHGFSQYPWEAWLNSAGTLRWDEAPATQWIVLHPELAVVVDARRFKQASVTPALLVHVLGFALYGETRSWFVGLSATGAVTTSSRWGMGGGGTLHFGHTQLYSRLPHLSLSVLLFATEQGKLGPFIGVSADFWRLVSDSSESLFRSSLPP